MKFNSKISESLTLKFAEAARDRKAKGKEIISLGLGEPDFNVPEEIKRATAEVLLNEDHGYSSPLGLPNFRAKIANEQKDDNGIPAEANNILVTPGAKQAFQMALMALLKPGDEVIVVNPSFVSFIPQIYIAEPEAVVKVLDVDMSDFSFPMKKLKEIVSDKTRLLIINSPNNPAGFTFQRKTLENIFKLANEKDFYLLSDEVYNKLQFSDTDTISLGSLETKVDKVFTVNGYSKSHAMTGWRIGYLIFPERFFKKLLKLQQHINTNTCTFIQKGILNAGNFDMGYLDKYNETLKSRVQFVAQRVSNIDGLSLVTPSAGFFAFIDISALKMDSNSFCSQLIDKTGVATTPGLAFGENWDDHFRLSYAVDQSTLERGLDLISEFVKDLS